MIRYPWPDETPTPPPTPRGMHGVSVRQTLAGPARFELEVKRSRHLAQAAPVADADEALAYVAAHGDRTANHNCWAYRIGSNYRFSDDGEPAGTAGRPILAAIEGQDVDHVVVLVTRWFGGIKLGAGGLARAYGGAAAECLRQAPRRELVEWVDAALEADFQLAGTLHGVLEQVGAHKLDETFQPSGVKLQVRLPADALDRLRTLLADASRGQARLSVLPAASGPSPR